MTRTQWRTAYRMARMGRRFSEFSGLWRMPMLLAGSWCCDGSTGFSEGRDEHESL